MKTVVPPGTPLGDLLASRPRSFRRTFFHSVWFWLLLFVAIGFLVNTISLIVQGAVFYAMIGVTSSQIAYEYNVSEPHIRHLLVSSVNPVAYKAIGYSALVTVISFAAAFMSRKLYRRGKYISALERVAAGMAPPDSPGDEQVRKPFAG